MWIVELPTISSNLGIHQVNVQTKTLCMVLGYAQKGLMPINSIFGFHDNYVIHALIK